jgi:hypothetical protein
LLDRGQRDVHDRDVEDDHEERDADERERVPAAGIRNDGGSFQLTAPLRLGDA